jgi:hypothetical protein
MRDQAKVIPKPKSVQPTNRFRIRIEPKNACDGNCGLARPDWQDLLRGRGVRGGLRCQQWPTLSDAVKARILDLGERGRKEAAPAEPRCATKLVGREEHEKLRIAPRRAPSITSSRNGDRGPLVEALLPRPGRACSA